MVEVWAKENKVIVVRKKVVMIDFMGAKIIHTSCDDTEGDDRGADDGEADDTTRCDDHFVDDRGADDGEADDTTRCDDKLRLMTIYNR